MNADELARAVAGLLDRDLHAGYAIVKADNEAKFTLGVAYPADSIDAHGEFASAAELEKAAWSAIARRITAGVGHRPGTDDAGVIVESYIWRFDPIEVNGERINKGDWVLGCVWSEPAWALIKAGKLQGYSIQGVARVKE